MCEACGLNLLRTDNTDCEQSSLIYLLDKIAMPVNFLQCLTVHANTTLSDSTIMFQNASHALLSSSKAYSRG